MKIALTGKPGCGRSTLFQALGGGTRVDTGKPLTVDVPDERLDLLERIHEPLKKTHAKVVFSDIPSPCFCPRNLGMARNAAVIAAVLDNYALGDLQTDLDEAETELMISDMALCEKRLQRLKKEGKAGSGEFRLLSRLMERLEEGIPLRTLDLSPDCLDILSPYSLLSLKPLMVICNRMGEPVTPEEEIEEAVNRHEGSLLRVDAGFELELTELEPEERGAFLESAGYSRSGLDRIIRKAYSALDLIVFFTVGKDEVRAWPVKRGSTAVEAAGAVHSDMARGFIRAEVVSWKTYSEVPDRNRLKETGDLRIEGKDYLIRDGDVVQIRFNV